MEIISLLIILAFTSFGCFSCFITATKLLLQNAENEHDLQILRSKINEEQSKKDKLIEQINQLQKNINCKDNDNITYLTHEKIIQSKAHELAIKRYNLQEGLNLKTISMKDKVVMSILLDRETCKIGQQLKEIKLRKQQSNST